MIRDFGSCVMLCCLGTVGAAYCAGERVTGI